MGALSDPEGQFTIVLVFLVGRFGDGRVWNGRHQSSLDLFAVDVKRGDSAADRDGQSVPIAIGQPMHKRLHPSFPLVSVVQPDFILPARTLQF